MRIAPAPHRWKVSPGRAALIQRELASRVERRGPSRSFRLVAGADAAFSADKKHCIAGVVLWDRKTGEVLEKRVVLRRLTFPYVPGLLSFREAPAVLDALRRLVRSPEVLIYDGHGLAHPRRFGIASHVGLLADLPTIGCAKSRLTGLHDPPGVARGARAALRGAEDGRVLGTVLRTREGVKPVYVSIGHKISLASAARTVLACAPRYRLPEPTRLADQMVSAVQRALEEPLADQAAAPRRSRN